jgi:hypothetical protein
MAWLLALSVINACEILMCNLLFWIGGADNATKCKSVNGQVRPRPHAHTAAGLNARGRAISAFTPARGPLKPNRTQIPIIHRFYFSAPLSLG